LTLRTVAMRRSCRRRAGSEDAAISRLPSGRPLDFVQDQFTAIAASSSRSASASGHEEPPRGEEGGGATATLRRSSMALCLSCRREPLWADLVPPGAGAPPCRGGR
jgi:hypothetical protein